MDNLIRAAQLAATPRLLRRPAPAPAPSASLAPAAPGPTLAAPAPLAPSGMELAWRAQAQAEIDAQYAALEQEQLAWRAGLETAKTQALEQASAQGQAAAAAAAHSAAQAQVAELTGLCAGVLKQLRQARQQVLDAAETECVELVFAGVCQILGAGGTSREQAGAAVRHGLADLRGRQALSLRLHPDDARLLAGEDWLAALPLVPDPALQLGGCILDSAAGSLDASFSTQLGRLAEVLLQARAARRAALQEDL